MQLKFVHIQQVNVYENKYMALKIPHGGQACGIFTAE
jgi:hypothetical protein